MSCNIKCYYLGKVSSFTNIYIQEGLESTVIGTLSDNILDKHFKTNNKIKVTLRYKKTKKNFILIKPIIKKKYKLSMFTLFRDDYSLLRAWIDYYKLLGVEHFFLYYNGRVASDVQKYMEQFDKDIYTLVEWDYSKQKTQRMAINSAIYKYKSYTKWLAIFDIKEYIVCDSLLDCVEKYNYMITSNVYFSNSYADIDVSNHSLSLKYLENNTIVRDIKLDDYPLKTRNVVNPNNIIVSDIHNISIKKENTKTINSNKYFLNFHRINRSLSHKTQTIDSSKIIENNMIFHKKKIINCMDKKWNGVYKINHKSKIRCYAKNNKYHLYFYKGLWRLGLMGKFVYMRLPQYKGGSVINFMNIKNKCNEIDIKIFLKQYIDRKVICIPSPNISISHGVKSSLFWYSTIALFDDIGLKYVIGTKKDNIFDVKRGIAPHHIENETLFYEWGSYCRNSIQINKKSNDIVILPCTIRNEDDLIKSFGKNIKIICKEIVSYKYVYKLIKHKSNVFLSHDLMFYIKNLNINMHTRDANKTFDKCSYGILNCYNKKQLQLVTRFLDINHNDDKSFNKIKSTALSLFKYISNYNTINTDRLYIAIVGSILNKNVNIYPDNCYKNKAVFDYSIKNVYQNTKFKKFKYVTITGNKDGFGAQLQAKMSALAYCAKNKNYIYLHTPFKMMAHNYNKNPNFRKKLENFAGMGLDEYQAHDFPNIMIEQKLFFPEVHWNSNPSIYYDEIIDILRKKYYHTKKPTIKYYKKNVYNCAIHIRRGNVDKNRINRYTNNNTYINLIKKIQKQYDNITFHIFSEGDIKDFSDIRKYNEDILFHLNIDIFTTFHSLVTTDILVLSKSSFSYTAGILSNGLVICNNMLLWWHKPLSNWIVI